LEPDITLWEKNGFSISTDKTFLDNNAIFRFLSEESYWAKGISRELVLKAIKNTDICVGIYEGNPAKESVRQVGFARIITDFVRFAYLMDVFVVKEYRGRGLSKWLMEIIGGHPQLMHVRRTMLATKDAHSLYAKYGFAPLEKPTSFMENVRRNG
jgi:hypothetical protein